MNTPAKQKNFIRDLYDYVLRLANHPKAELALFVVAFAESSFFPIPPDVMLIPMVLVRMDRAFRYAFVCTMGSVLGGVVGYFIGQIFYDAVGNNIIAFYGLQDSFQTLKQWYAEYDVYIVGVAGFSPIPYKLFTITSGMLEADLVKFFFASLISRGARFFIVAWLLWRGGRRFKGWIEYNLNPLTMAACIALIMFIVMVKILAH